MYEYINYFQPPQRISYYDHRILVAEAFFDRYKKTKAQDIYRWIWEGEFGYGVQGKDNSLDTLIDDIRISRIRNRDQSFPIYEDLGLTGKLLKVNIVPYSDTACPLLRLIMLSEQTLRIKPDTLRFKKNWHFIKTQIVPGMGVTLDEIHDFENSIPFHMTPELPYSDEFLQEFGVGYRIVPVDLFFRFFPEYDPDTQFGIDFV